jgi:hypothetical protein
MLAWREESDQWYRGALVDMFGTSNRRRWEFLLKRKDSLKMPLGMTLLRIFLAQRGVHFSVTASSVLEVRYWSSE